VITRSDPVVQAIDAFLLALDPEVFRDALPVLRRAFGQLGATERRYLHETLMRVRKIGAARAAARAVLDAVDKSRVADLDQELSSVMDDLEDLF
jgi:predicted ATPase